MHVAWDVAHLHGSLKVLVLGFDGDDTPGCWRQGGWVSLPWHRLILQHQLLARVQDHIQELCLRDLHIHRWEPPVTQHIGLSIVCNLPPLVRLPTELSVACVNSISERYAASTLQLSAADQISLIAKSISCMPVSGNVGISRTAEPQCICKHATDGCRSCLPSALQLHACM